MNRREILLKRLNKIKFLHHAPRVEEMSDDQLEQYINKIERVFREVLRQLDGEGNGKG